MHRLPKIRWYIIAALLSSGYIAAALREYTDPCLWVRIIWSFNPSLDSTRACRTGWRDCRRSSTDDASVCTSVRRSHCGTRPKGSSKPQVLTSTVSQTIAVVHECLIDVLLHELKHEHTPGLKCYGEIIPFGTQETSIEHHI